MVSNRSPCRLVDDFCLAEQNRNDGAYFRVRGVTKGWAWPYLDVATQVHGCAPKQLTQRSRHDQALLVIEHKCNGRRSNSHWRILIRNLRLLDPQRIICITFEVLTSIYRYTECPSQKELIISFIILLSLQ